MVLILDIVRNKLEMRNEAKREIKNEEFCFSQAMNKSYKDIFTSNWRYINIGWEKVGTKS